MTELFAAFWALILRNWWVVDVILVVGGLCI